MSRLKRTACCSWSSVSLLAEAAQPHRGNAGLGDSASSAWLTWLSALSEVANAWWGANQISVARRGWAGRGGGRSARGRNSSA